MLERLFSFLPAAQNIFFNVVGGILTVWLTSLYLIIRRNLQRRRFKKVFGYNANSHFLCFGSMILHPALLQLIPREGEKLKRFPLTKRHNLNISFSAENAASACEIRAAAYVAPALARDGGVSSVFASDDSLSEKLDIDFISFGALSNRKTLDLFSNEANDLADFDLGEQFFVWKGTRARLCAPRDGHDYGIILKIHPKQFPQRTWIACAGLGEWGTSGAAWFLAKKWKEIESRVQTDAKFLSVIEVKPGQDESATLIAVYPTIPPEIVAPPVTLKVSVGPQTPSSAATTTSR